MKSRLTKKYQHLATDSASCNESHPPPAKRRKLFSFMTARHTITQPASSTEVTKYLNLPCISEEEKPLDYWKKEDTFPVLSSLACKYLCIPASSGPVERLFSIAGKVFRPERCRIGDEQFQQLMMIRCNQQ